MVDIKSVKMTDGNIVEQNIAVSQQGDIVSTQLQNNEILKLGISPDQIQTTTREGQNLVIQLKDGSQIVIQDYFLQANPQVALQQGELLWDMQLAETPTGLQADYLAVSSLSELGAVSGAGAALFAGIPTWGLAAAGVAGLGGVIAAVASSGGSSNKEEKDTTAPKAGTLSFTNYIDTGAKADDFISQDKSFDLSLVGQEVSSNVVYQISKDGGKTWTTTTVKQSDLADGDYQFRAVVKDAVGNTAYTNIQKVTVDTVVQ
ncbi:BapA/Bap/LapF family prefix-like domain-containing protein, partial [Acinetobacter sp. CFCC 10889]|uniref:BapA/Bap/LapF family prefix-like domain-containing protein n=1 Tax=Acinetobacter sp. CFCC 10889 TaxID=1775557 RepID=UPI0013A6D912